MKISKKIRLTVLSVIALIVIVYSLMGVVIAFISLILGFAAFALILCFAIKGVYVTLKELYASKQGDEHGSNE